MRLPWLVVSLFLAATLAGCADDAPAPEEADFSALELEADDETGVIRGVVIDETITPIAGATVTLNDGTQTLSTADGLFGFEGLLPGTYFLMVGKDGYNKVQQAAGVVAGVASPAIVKVQLTLDPSSSPFVVTSFYEAFLSCSFKAANYVFDADSCDPTGAAGYAASDDSWHMFDTGVAQPAQTYQVEIDWEATQPLSDGMVTIQCAREDTSGTHCNSGVTGGSRLCNVRGAAPLICRVDAEGELPSGGQNLTAVNGGEGFQGVYSVGIYSNCAYSCVPGTVVGAGAALEQSIYIYSNIFYNYEPPEGWTFLSDGAYAPK